MTSDKIREEIKRISHDVKDIYGLSGTYSPYEIYGTILVTHDLVNDIMLRMNNGLLNLRDITRGAYADGSTIKDIQRNSIVAIKELFELASLCEYAIQKYEDYLSK